MSKAVGWIIVLVLVVLLGTHPGVLAGLLGQALDVLHRAGDELGSFVSKL